MADIKDERLPYEILIRYRDGVFSGAHVQYIRRVTLGDEVLKNEELPAEALSIDGFPTSSIMTDATRDAMSAANAALAENDALKSENADIKSRLGDAMKKIAELMDELSASRQIVEQAYQAKDVP